MIDWNKEFFNTVCSVPYVGSGIRNLHNASACLALLPTELDTPKIKEIRKFFEKHNIRPKHNPYFLGRNEEYTYQTTYKDKDVMREAIWENYHNLRDAIIDTAYYCNQKPKWERVYESEYVFHNEISGVENKGTPICTVNFDLLKEAERLAGELFKEIPKITEKIERQDIKKLIEKKWIERYAWDLTPEEINHLNLQDKVAGG